MTVNSTTFRSEFSSSSPITGTTFESNECHAGFVESPLSAAGSKLSAWNSMNHIVAINHIMERLDIKLIYNFSLILKTKASGGHYKRNSKASQKCTRDILQILRAIDADY